MSYSENERNELLTFTVVKYPVLDNITTASCTWKEYKTTTWFICKPSCSNM